MVWRVYILVFVFEVYSLNFNFTNSQRHIDMGSMTHGDQWRCSRWPSNQMCSCRTHGALTALMFSYVIFSRMLDIFYFNLLFSTTDFNLFYILYAIFYFEDKYLDVLHLFFIYKNSYAELKNWTMVKSIIMNISENFTGNRTEYFIS